MNEQRTNEIARREQAQAHAGEIVAGSGKQGTPRRMARMVSARLDADLVRQLQNVAQQRNTTLSDLLREGAELIVQEANAAAVTFKATKTEGVHWNIQRGQGKSGFGSSQPQSPEGMTTTTRHGKSLATA